LLIVKRSKTYYTASGIITVHRLKEDCLLSTCARDGHLQVWWYQRLY